MVRVVGGESAAGEACVRMRLRKARVRARRDAGMVVGPWAWRREESRAV